MVCGLGSENQEGLMGEGFLKGKSSPVSSFCLKTAVFIYLSIYLFVCPTQCAGS